MHTIGFTTVTFRGMSRRQICETAVKNGIRAIEWGGDVHLPPEDLQARQEVIALQEEFGIRAASYGSYYRLGANDLSLWEQVTDTAAAIGADTIRIWQGGTSSSLVQPEEYAAMVEETRKLAELAEKKGLTVAFEFHQNTNNDCGKAAVAFLEAVDRENVKTYWQPLGNPQEDLENLQAVLPWLSTVHVFYWENYMLRYSLKEGEELWSTYISTIEKADVKPGYIMEFVKEDDPEQFARDVQTLREWIR